MATVKKERKRQPLPAHVVRNLNGELICSKHLRLWPCAVCTGTGGG